MRVYRPYSFIIVFVYAATSMFTSMTEVRADRVGYSFQGALIQSGSAGNYTLFNISVSKTSPIAGTFSYDSDSQGIDGGTGVLTYRQLIQGGYTMNINNGAIQLSASDFNITITNDSGSPSFDSFIVGYVYDSTANPPLTPQQVLANGAPWTGTKAEIYLQEKWDPAAFSDAALTPDRPIGPGAMLPDSQCLCADVRSTATPRFFSITSIIAIPLMSGDYNRDGKLDGNDYIEWRKAFGETDPHYVYADGNNDGVVDAADYVVWRREMSAGGPDASTALPLPEPGAILLAGIGTVVMSGRRRYNLRSS